MKSLDKGKEIRIRDKEKYIGRGRPKNTEYVNIKVTGLDNNNWKGVAEL